MRIAMAFLCISILGLTSLSVMVYKAPVQENYLIGEWKETRWQYDNEKQQPDNWAGEHYRIHRAETWQFEPNGIVKLQCKGECITARWSIKGRGHILQIKYNDKHTENYQLTELDSVNMTLNYECDAQAKGIAILNFKKLKA